MKVIFVVHTKVGYTLRMYLNRVFIEDLVFNTLEEAMDSKIVWNRFINETRSL